MLHMVLRLRGGKPVIYLSSPKDVVATVRLDLVKQWETSALHPVVRVKKSAMYETVEWRVKTCADGSLVETDTGPEVAYLFWEAL